MNNDAGGTNVQEGSSESIGRAGKAIKSTKTIDFSGQFVNTDGTLGMNGVLMDANFHKDLNFNPLSLSRLLKNGWKIVKGGDSVIVVDNNAGERIDFGIVVDTSKGLIFACKFIQTGKLSLASMADGTKMSIDTVHSLLGHLHEDASQKVAQYLGWEISCGSMKPCEHCAKAKAKQKNVVKESKAEKAK